MTSASLTARLVELSARPVSARSRQRAALHLLDWLGCALVGGQSAAGRELARYQAQSGDHSQRCFSAVGSATHAEQAAFVNGGLGNIYELDDVHRTAVLHCGDVVIPAALALAQQYNASPLQLLDSIVAGYETAIRIGLVAAGGGYSAWYNSGTCGVFGAAMAAARVSGLSASQCVDALGQAGMMAAGLWQCRLEATFSKQLACANAARNGVLAARLAAGDFPGPQQILEGELGFFNTLYPGSQAADVLCGPTADWKIHEVSFKPWPACRHVHPAIEATLALRARNPNATPQQLHVSTYAAAVEFCDNPTPANAHQARFSLQYAVALAWLTGAPQLEHFELPMRSSQALLALASRVQLSADAALSDAFPLRYAARVELRSDAGYCETLSVDTAAGDPENPLSQPALLGKFRQLATAAGIEEGLANDLIDTLLMLPESRSMQAFNSALHTVAQATSALQQQ